MSNMFLALQKFILKARTKMSQLKLDDEERVRIRSWIRLWKTWDKSRFHSYITEINSKHESSFLFSFQVELMLLLAILNELKSFRWYFLMFANSWIYWKFKFYWYVKKFSFDYLLASRCIIFQLNHFPQFVNTIAK